MSNFSDTSNSGSSFFQGNDLSKRIFREYAEKYQLPFLDKSARQSMRYTGIVRVMNEILEEVSGRKF